VRFFGVCFLFWKYSFISATQEGKEGMEKHNEMKENWR
jgi:hypothetical protein